MEDIRASYTFLGTLIVLLSLLARTNAICSWPTYFDVSKKYWEYGDEEKSWETKTKADTEFYTEINGYYKSRQLITIQNNNTLEITYSKELQRVWSEKYDCERSFNNDLYLIKRVDVVMNLLPGDIIINKIDKSIKYRCMQLVKRSQFVLQWVLGPLKANSHECYSTGKDQLDPSPLVYFPVRNIRSDEKIFEYSKLFSDYPACPKLGGYLMQVYEGNGSHVSTHGCKAKNEDPSPRFEMECTAGEGLQISQSTQPCSRYFFSFDAGSKLYCLGTWEEGRYTYTVLLPADSLNNINTMHCLRIENMHSSSRVKRALLFLDNICDAGNPDPKKVTFLRLVLRQKKISSVCDDYSDRCGTIRRTCNGSVERSACMSSCSACAKDSPPGINFDEMLRGSWFLPKTDMTETINIMEKDITLPRLGTFSVHANPQRYTCNRGTNILSDGFQYVLSTTNVLPGCTPRVIQLTMKNVSESVSLLHFTNPSTIRYNKFALNSSTWCRNNKMDTDANAQFFRPYWPFSTRPGSSIPQSGWYTLINSDHNTHQSTECNLIGYKIGYAADMVTKATLNLGQKYKCDAVVKSNGTNTLIVNFNNCENKVKHNEMRFDCLANYRMSADYQALTLKVSESSSDQLLKNTKYYCLLLPAHSDRRRLYIIMHSAGLCDYPFSYLVRHNHEDPVVKMAFMHSLVASSVRQEPILYLLFAAFGLTILF